MSSNGQDTGGSADVSLQVVEIVGPQPGPNVLITGGVHGDEFEPMVAIRALIQRLGDEQATPLKTGIVRMLPVVNEAAFLRGTRTAADELDLARVCPGSPDGSITERTAHALSKMIRESDYYLDLHTGGCEMSVVPMAGYVLHHDEQVLQKQRSMAEAFNLPVLWGTSGNLPGRSLSVARDAHVPAIYTEHGGGGRCRPEGAADYLQGCLNVLDMLKMIDVERPPRRVRHWIEDPTPGSGHMQVCNASPMTGYFEPAVTLGDSVQRGQPLGTVTDTLGAEVKEVPADTAGVVLALRTFPRVLAGHSVGVICDTAFEVEELQS